MGRRYKWEEGISEKKERHLEQAKGVYGVRMRDGKKAEDIRRVRCGTCYRGYIRYMMNRTKAQIFRGWILYMTR